MLARRAWEGNRGTPLLEISPHAGQIAVGQALVPRVVSGDRPALLDPREIDQCMSDICLAQQPCRLGSDRCLADPSRASDQQHRYRNWHGRDRPRLRRPRARAGVSNFPARVTPPDGSGRSAAPTSGPGTSRPTSVEWPNIRLITSCAGCAGSRPARKPGWRGGEACMLLSGGSADVAVLRGACLT
jgi:hypothetical protein